MSRQKTYWVPLLALSALLVVSLVGCKSGEDFSFYLMEKREDYELFQMQSFDAVQKATVYLVLAAMSSAIASIINQSKVG